MRARLRVPLVSLALLACGPDGLADEGDDEIGDTIDAEHQAEIDQVEDDLHSIVEAALAFYEQDPGAGMPHLCPHPNGSPAGGEASITPELAVNCNAGPQGRCIPSVENQGAGYYDPALWADNSVWAPIGFAKTEPHCFHFNLVAINDITGFGSCVFTAQAFADLDDDQIFSTYEVRGAVDENGSVVEALFVDLPHE